MDTPLRIQLILCLLAIGFQCANSGLTLTKLVKDKHEMFSSMKAIKTNVDQFKGLKRFVNAMKNLQISARKFFDSPRLTGDKAELKSLYRALHDTGEGSDALFLDTGVRSFLLGYNNYVRQGSIFSHLDSVLFNLERKKLKMYIKKLQQESLCKETEDYADEMYFAAGLSVQQICISSVSCSKSKHLYPYRCENIHCTPQNKEYFYEQVLTPACTVFKKCDVKKALPMMVGVFWYQINEMIFQRLCPQQCKGPCDYVKTFQKLMKDAESLIMYAETLPSLWNPVWKPFFDIASSHTLSDVNIAEFESKLTDQNRLKSAEKQCSVIEAPNACSVVEMKKNYDMLKRLAQDRISIAKVKNLRRHADKDLAKAIELKRDNLQFLKLSTQIYKLENSMKVSFESISNYFVGVATYDEKIAATEREFVMKKLKSYKNLIGTVQTRLVKDIKVAMNYMTGILGANLASQIAKMAALLLKNSNPLKLLTSGPDVKALADQAENIADATSKVVKGVALVKAMAALQADTSRIATAFGGNTRQIESLSGILDKIVNGNSDLVLDSEFDSFIEEYASYRPTVSGHLLAKNNALWSSYKSAICSVLNGQVSIAGAVLKSIAGSKLLCERLDGTLAQFFSIRRGIFDFQFQLLDALVSISRANKAKRYAKNIGKKPESIDASQLLSGYFLAQCALQKACAAYCDELEYKHFGKPLRACVSQTGLFSKHNDDLLSYDVTIAYEQIDRSVYLPTRTESQGDTGVIDLQALARGENVIFKVPNDRAWLLKYGWIKKNDKSIPFVKDFKIFLPHKKYDELIPRETDIRITSIAESQVSVGNLDDTVYLLPESQASFRNVFEEGYSSCKNELKNPYSLCNNLPNICDKSKKVNADGTLMPTILSMWSIEVSVSVGLRDIKYDPPSPGTNFLVRAEATLKMPYRRRKKRAVPLPPSKAADSTKDGCCLGNKYRLTPFGERGCAECPKGTTAFLGGLYCQIDDKAN